MLTGSMNQLVPGAVQGLNGINQYKFPAKTLRIGNISQVKKEEKRMKGLKNINSPSTATHKSKTNDQDYDMDDGLNPCNIIKGATTTRANKRLQLSVKLTDENSIFIRK